MKTATGTKLSLVLAGTFAMAVPAQAQSVDWQCPAVSGAGPVVPVPDATAEPD